MHTYLIDEIGKLRADKISVERIGSIIMSLNKNLKILGDKKPSREDDSYNVWEEKYYEVKQLAECAEYLREAVSAKRGNDIERRIDEFKAAAADFEMIYGDLSTWRIK